MKRRFLKWSTFFAVAFVALNVWARAGGAGGGSFGGEGGGGDNDLLWFYGEFFIRVIPTLLRMGPVGWIILAALIFLIYVFIKKYYGRDNSEWAAPKIRAKNAGKPVDDVLRRKIETAFMTVQQAWSEQNTKPMRRFISDGVYQRFNAQFKMMQLLGQSNPMSNVQIHDISRMPDRDLWRGVYENVDVCIEASAVDQFISTTHPELNSPGGNERFVEYWSFIRRCNHLDGKDIYHSDLCPRCSAPLSDKMMDDARCKYCGAYINNGEFDWVLSEITQEDDYTAEAPRFHLPPNFKTSDALFSVQVLEDKASNAFMQILIAQATRDMKAMRRFCTNEQFANFQAIFQRSSFIYDRLYLNSCETRDIDLDGDTFRATIAIRYSYHEVGSIDQIVTEDKTLILFHRPTGVFSKGTIYANACPTCGAPQKDSLAHACVYCGANLNDVTRDWIVGGFE